ncbi:hypothetical protein LOK74_08050 [Brevibacillus humidisoli]|uniref:hypothetical protein n=1 Tax=Brevibacillus humidisoli TaxID=2895522 RepID=UPI001E3D8406|nr:hypothetical protein [Brevibacillus humidisoli]UFJ42426.1 hypothetical protein LOK74_08050 [Brevibacillus humidisoli]
MNKRWIGSLTAAIIIAGGIGGYWYWQTPYALPEISETITQEQLNLVFAEEQEVASRKMDKQEAERGLPQSMDRLEPDQAPYAYYYGLSLLEEDREQALAYLGAAVQAVPTNLVYSTDYRIALTRENGYQEALDFFAALDQNVPEVKLQTALVYVDMLQEKGVGTAWLGQRSTLSIRELNQILEQNPNDWLAHYARGLNNLYWPSGLQRIDKAVQDLSFCLAALKQLGDQSFPFWPQLYEAYGDALVKSGDTSAGYAVWKDGLRHYPDAEGLKQRVDAGEEQAMELVKQIRGIDSFQPPAPEITDLSIIWNQKADES